MSIASVLVSALVPGCSWPNLKDSSGETETGEHSSGVSPGNTSSGVIEATGTGSSADSGTTDGAANTGEVTVSTSGPATGTTGVATTDVSTTTGAGTTDGSTTGAGSTGAGTTDGGTTDGSTTGAGTTDGSTTDGSTTDGSTTDGSTTGGAMSECPNDDKWEANGLPEDAAAVPWGNSDTLSSYVAIDAFLCAGDSDWYHVSVETLDYQLYALHLNGIVQGSSWCGMSCDEPWLPAAPENAVGIEVYDAATLELLGNQEAQNGRVKLGGLGEAYSKDLLIRVYSPTPAATYDYELFVEIRNSSGEDECEC